MSDALVQNHVRFLLAIASPRAAVSDMIAKRGYDLVGALRGVASSAGVTRRLASLPDALVLQSDHQYKTPAATARTICDHFDIAISDHDLRRILSQVDSSGVRDAEQWWSDLSDDQRILIDEALEGFCEPGGQAERFTWSPQLFFMGDSPNEAPTQAIDITGRARCLLYGPFITIPPGHWSVHVTLASSKASGGTAFVVEAFAGSPLGHVVIHAPAAGGVFDAHLTFTIESSDASADHPFQVRIFNERAVFDGRLGLGKVTLTAQTLAKAEVTQALAASLGLTTH